MGPLQVSIVNMKFVWNLHWEKTKGKDHTGYLGIRGKIINMKLNAVTKQFLSVSHELNKVHMSYSVEWYDGV